jgi:hypothetical protein
VVVVAREDQPGDQRLVAYGEYRDDCSGYWTNGICGEYTFDENK